MKNEYSKEDTILVLKEYKDSRKYVSNGICYFVINKGEELGLQPVDFYGVYSSLGISDAGLSFDTHEMKVQNGKNPLRIKVVEMLIEVLEDPSVYFAEMYPTGILDITSDECTVVKKIQQLKDFIASRQDPEKINQLIEMN